MDQTFMGEENHVLFFILHLITLSFFSFFFFFFFFFTLNNHIDKHLHSFDHIYNCMADVKMDYYKSW